MTGVQFNTTVSILFVGYVLMQVPSNMLITRRKMQIKGAAILGGIQPFGVSSEKMVCVMQRTITAR